MMILLVWVLVVGGYVSFTSLPRMEDPMMEARFATIVTPMPGASAEQIEVLITDPLEEKISEIDEIELIKSTTRPGVSTVTLQIADAIANPSDYWPEIRDAVREAEAQFPQGALPADFIQQELLTHSVIIGLSWVGKQPPNAALLSRNADRLRSLTENIPGTKSVDVFGDAEEQVQVELDLNRLRQLNLSVAEVAQALRQSDIEVPMGDLRTSTYRLTLDGPEFSSLADIEQVVVRSDKYGRVVPLRQVATVSSGFKDPADTKVLVDENIGVTVGIACQSDYKVDVWTKDILQHFRNFEQTLPDTIQADLLFQQSRYTEESLNNLIMNFGISCILVFLVSLFMLGWHAAIVVALALPLTTGVVLITMNMMDIPIHRMSIMGIVIAIGILIDNAIVVADALRDEKLEGKSDEEALDGLFSHLFLPLLSSTMTTVLAFMPLILMPGGAADFVGPIAYTVVAAIIGSFFLAMFVFSVMYLRIFDLLQWDKIKGTWLVNGVVLPKFSQRFQQLLVLVYQKPLIPMLIVAGVAFLGFIGVRTLPEQFFPASDRDQATLVLRLPDTATLAETERVALKATELLKQDERVAEVCWTLGRNGPIFFYNMGMIQERKPNYAQGLLQYHPGVVPTKVNRDMQVLLRDSLPSVQAMVVQLEQGPPFEAPVEIRVYGPNPKVQQKLCRQIRLLLTDFPEITYITDNTQGQKVLRFKGNPVALKSRGLTERSVIDTLNGLLAGYPAGTLVEGDKELPVRVKAQESQAGDLERIKSQLIPGTNLTIGEAGSYQLESEYVRVDRRHKRRFAVVQAYLLAGALPSVTLSKVQKAMEKAELKLPPGYEISFGGEAEERDKAVGNLASSMTLIMLLMMTTLVLAFRSFRLAGVVAIVGVLSIGMGLLALTITGYPFGFMAIVGVMGLVGVAINDTIVVLAALEEFLMPDDGAKEAAEIVMNTSRHVLSTSMTTAMGFLPLIVGGGLFWPPLAVAIGGGVLGATLIALFFAPPAYLVTGRQRRTRSVEDE